MGCGPEWPLCNGKVIPTLEGETLIEFGHRFVGLILVFLIGLLFIRLRKESHSQLMLKAANWMVVLLTIQVLAGAIVVILDLPPIVVTLHLLVAMLFISILIWVFRQEQQRRIHLPFQLERQSIKRKLNLLIFLVFLTIGLGAYIKHQTFGLSCHWLYCGDTLLPREFPQLLQTLHRFLALVTLLYIFYFCLISYAKKMGAFLKRRSLLMVLVILLQLLSGVLTIVTSISISWAVIHLAIGTLLLLVIVDTRILLNSPNE